MNLFIQSASLDLQVQMNDSTEWKMKINGWQWIYSIMKEAFAASMSNPMRKPWRTFTPTYAIR